MRKQNAVLVTDQGQVKGWKGIKQQLHSMGHVLENFLEGIDGDDIRLRYLGVCKHNGMIFTSSSLVIYGPGPTLYHDPKSWLKALGRPAAGMGGVASEETVSSPTIAQGPATDDFEPESGFDPLDPKTWF